MAGELNFSASLVLDNINEVQNQIRAMIKDIEKNGSGLDAAFAKATKAADGVGKELDEASTKTKGLGDSIENNVSSPMNNLLDMARKFGVAFGVEELVRKIINVRGEFQQLEIAFETMLGSSSEAQSLMSQLTETAAKTPFEMQDIAQGAKQLLAYGTASEQVNDTLIHLGDIAAGLSIPMNDLVYLYGTTMAQGRMFTQDLRQMQGRGIPIAEEIAKILNVSKDAVPAMVSAGKVTADVFDKAIKNMTSEGGKFYNLMEKQSESLTGQISNLEDAFANLFNELGKSSEGVLSGGISAITFLVENLQSIASLLAGITAVYGAYKAAVIAVNAVNKAQAAITHMMTVAQRAHINATKTQIVFINLLKRAQKALNLVMATNPWVIAATAVTALGVGIYAVVSAESAEEKAIRKSKEEHKKYMETLNNEAEKNRQYVNTLKSSTASINEQAEALKELQKIDAFKGKTQEQIAAMSQSDIDKAITEDKNKKEEQNLFKQLSEAKGRLKYYEREPIFNQENIKLAKQNIEDIKKQIKERNDFISQSNKQEIIKNKAYWEKIKNDAEESLASLDVSAKGSQEWNDLEKIIADANKQLEAWNKEEDKAKKSAEEIKKQEEERLRIQKELNEYHNKIYDDIDELQYGMHIDALEKEIELTDDLNQKLKLQEERNKLILKRKKEIYDAETQNAIKSVVGDDEYAKYTQGKGSVKTQAIAQEMQSSAQQKWLAEEAKYEQEVFYDTLQVKTDAYKEFSEKMYEIEQKRIEREREIESNTELTTDQRIGQKQKNNLVAQNAKDLLSATSGIGQDMIANVATLVNNIITTGADQINQQILVVSQEIDNKIAEYNQKLAGDELSDDERASLEQKIVELTAQRNLLIKQGNNLISQQEGEIGKTEGATGKLTKLTEKQVKDVRAVGDAFGSIGSTADMILNEIGGALSDAGKEALSAISAIADFGQGAMQLVASTGEAVENQSKAMMASSIIGWIMLAIQLLVKLGTFLAQYSAENRLKKEIDATLENVDLLKKKYELLEKREKLEGKVGQDALRSKIKLAGEMNSQIDEQKVAIEKLKELEEMQIKQYGENSDKVKETQEQLMEEEGNLLDMQQDQVDQAKEVFEELATTDLTSFAENMASAMVDSFAEGLDGMKTAYRSTVQDLIRDQMTKQLSLKLIDQLKPAFNKLENYTSDAYLSELEIESFISELEKAEEGAMIIGEQYKKVFQKLGLMDDITNIEAESKGFETLNQDTADELNGRFTALQISGANIEAQQRVAEEQRFVLSQQNIELISHSKSIADQVTISTQIAQNQLNELREINAHTAIIRSLDDRLRNIESYTSKL